MSDTKPFELKNRSGSEPVTEPPVSESPVSESAVEDEVGAADESAVDQPETASEEPSSWWSATVGGVARWAWGALAASIALCGGAWVMGSWAKPSHEAEVAALRDQAVVQGSRAIETLQSLDYREIDAGVQRWQDVTTGVLHDQFQAMTEQQRGSIEDAAKVTTARIVSAGLTDLDATTATMIASTEVTVGSADESETPTVKRNRWAAELTLVQGQWKIENIQQVAVSVS